VAVSALRKQDVLAGLTVGAVLAHFGVKAAPSGRQLRVRRCPACGERARDAVVVSQASGQWYCHAHQHRGDLLAMVAGYAGLSARTDFAQVLAVAGQIGPPSSAVASPADLRAPPPLFTSSQVAALWAQLPPVTGTAAQYLTARSVGALAAQADIVRMTPGGAAAGTTWPATIRGFLRRAGIVVPVRALADGAVCNLVRRGLAPRAGPRVVSLAGVRKVAAGGPVGAFGVWHTFASAPRDVVLVEGVFDYLTALLRWPTALVIGADGAGHLPGLMQVIAPAVAAAGARVRLAPHRDDAGAQAHAAVLQIATAAGLTVGRDLEVIDVAPGNDLNDTARVPAVPSLTRGADALVAPPAPPAPAACDVASAAPVPAVAAPVRTTAGPRWVTPLGDFLGAAADTDAAADWVIRDVIPRGEPGLIVGPPKCGKTWLALDLALAVATGQPWLGTFPHATGAPQRVLVLALEDAVRRTRRRLAALARGRGVDLATLDGTLAISATPVALPGGAPLRALTAELAAWRPAVVLIDNLTRTMVGDPNATRDAAAFSQAWGHLCQATGAAVVFLHHTAKLAVGERGPRSPQDRVRGSGDFVATARNVLVLAPVAGATPPRAVVEVFGNLELARPTFTVGYEATRDAAGQETVRLVDVATPTSPAERAPGAAGAIPARPSVGPTRAVRRPCMGAAARAALALTLARQAGVVSVTHLAAAVPCSRGSASSTLAALRRRGLIEVDGQAGHRLTAAGRARAGGQA